MLVEFQRRVDALGQCRVDNVEVPVLSRDDDHHVRNVLRARVGEEIVVTNGAGSWAFARIDERGIERTSDVVIDPVRPETTLYLAPLKGDRSEWAVAKATELGVSRIVPLITERLAVKFKGEVRAKVVSRWRRIAAEAAGQCRRTYDLVIAEPMAVSDVPLEVAVCDFDGEADWTGVRSVAVGPEGGFSPSEWDPSRRRLSLGPTVLRGETAGVVAASFLSFSNGGWGFTISPSANE